MPTPSEIARAGCRSAVNVVKEEVLPPIMNELKKENQELRERIQKLEEIVEKLLNQK